jgi:hypothetical protein
MGVMRDGCGESPSAPERLGVNGAACVLRPLLNRLGDCGSGRWVCGKASAPPLGGDPAEEDEVSLLGGELMEYSSGAPERTADPAIAAGRRSDDQTSVPLDPADMAKCWVDALSRVGGVRGPVRDDTVVGATA